MNFRPFNPDMAWRLVLDLLVIYTLVRHIYYPRHRNKDFLFSFTIFNIIIFLICYLFGNSSLNIGFAFGLFAIFSILRYRTVAVPIREMAYLLACVTLGILNALYDPAKGFFELLFSNAMLLMVTWLMDRTDNLPHENSKTIIYERIDKLSPNLRQELLEDLKARTGLPIHRIELGRIDFTRDSVRIKIFYMGTEIESANGSPEEGDD